MNFAEKLKRLRKNKNLSQQDVADAIGLHLTNYNRLENGHSQPSYEILKKLMGIFGVSGDYLLNDDADDFEVKINNKTLAEKIRLLDTLGEEEQRTIINVIDSMLTNQKVRELMTQKAQLAS